MPRWQAALLAIAACSGIRPALAAAEAEEDGVGQEVQYLWPVSLAVVPLTTDDYPHKGDLALEDPGLGRVLAQTGEECYKRYLRDVLPQELEKDPKFAAEFGDADASRVHRAFLRWQKRVFAKVSKAKVEWLDWDGKPVPEIPGVDYTWREFYGSREYRVLRKRIEQSVDAYLTSINGNPHDYHPYRTFIWAEVYRQGDFQRPHTHTGAVAAGTYVAQYARTNAGAQKIAIEDPRGINPPYGKTHNHQPTQGELLIWPAWTGHFVTPHPVNATNVYFSFLAWPPGGSPDFDWEDDSTADYAYKKLTKIRRRQSEGKGGRKGDEL